MARIGSVTTLIGFAMPAIASGVLPIEGAFGNAFGCRLYATGVPKPGYLLLTGDTLSSGGVGCDFDALVSADATVFTVKAVCSPGGARTVRVIDHGIAGYGFIVGEGDELGPLPACSPAGATARPPGVEL